MLQIRFAPLYARPAMLGASLAALLLPCIASATLGEPEATVQSDGPRVIDGQPATESIKFTERGTYRIHEMTLVSGTVLREFVGPDGNVFAIAWSGPSMPDLRQTLGRYFESYLAGVKAQPSGRTHVEIRDEGFVAQAGGHMRAFAGRAYLPQAVPAGMPLGDVR